MSEQFHHHELPNGLVLVGQRMEQVSSAAMCLVLPAGSVCDPAGGEGAAEVACEWILRGAGQRGFRELTDAMDHLGCNHGEDVAPRHLVFHAAQLGANLLEVLALYADIVRRPALAEEHFDPCRALIAQDLAALEDEPARKCTMLLHERFYPYPLGRNPYGTRESLAGLSAETVRGHVGRCFSPRGGILSVAGAIDWPAVRGRAEDLLGDWTTPAPPAAALAEAPGGITHLAKKSAQAHIALAHRAPTMPEASYYPARLAATVLSGGMSSRLLTEIREKRGLVYHVSTQYHSLKDYAGMFTYAGTPPERAQETLQAVVAELRRLGEGVTPDEMARARTQLKSALVMQGESTGARATALANDWYHLGRLRSLREISAAIDAVGAEDVLEYLRAFPAEDFTALTIGPEALDTSCLAPRPGECATVSDPPDAVPPHTA